MDTPTTEHALDEFKLCPFCGSQPTLISHDFSFEDDHRYVSLQVKCCSKMEVSIGYGTYRHMQQKDIQQALKTKLLEKWNRRFVTEEEE